MATVRTVFRKEPFEMPDAEAAVLERAGLLHKEPPDEPSPADGTGPEPAGSGNTPVGSVTPKPAKPLPAAKPASDPKENA